MASEEVAAADRRDVDIDSPAGPSEALIVADETGHSVYWERPDVFNAAVLDFIGRHLG
jgi:pimeloyl-ACP methyl ester carboxylesterase